MRSVESSNVERGAASWTTKPWSVDADVPQTVIERICKMTVLALIREATGNSESQTEVKPERHPAGSGVEMLNRRIIFVIFGLHIPFPFSIASHEINCLDSWVF